MYKYHNFLFLKKTQGYRIEKATLFLYRYKRHKFWFLSEVGKISFQKMYGSMSVILSHLRPSAYPEC